MESNKEKNFASAVVYCYNDAKTIGSFIENLDKTLADNFLKYEIVVVDDYSKDDSVEIVKKYASHKEGKVISVLKMSSYHGVEPSMNAGLNLAIGDFVFEFDCAYADFDWSIMIQIYKKSLTGYDIVNALPNEKPESSMATYLRLFNHYAKLQHPLGIDTCRVISRRAINRVHSITQTIPFRKIAYANCGLEMTDVEYTPSCPIPAEKRKMPLSKAIDSFILFTDLAFRISITLAVIMFLVTIAMGVYAIVLNFFMTPVAGWTTTIVFLSLGFAGLFVILSMVIKYLQTLVNLVFKKKDYLFESITKLQ